jgi:hypothetical protein
VTNPPSTKRGLNKKIDVAQIEQLSRFADQNNNYETDDFIVDVLNGDGDQTDLLSNLRKHRNSLKRNHT